MSRAQWMVVVTAMAGATMAAPAAAHAAPERILGPEATARAYVAAVRAHDERRLCALWSAASDPRDGFDCKRYLRETTNMKVLQARVGAAFRRGTRARLVVDLVYGYKWQSPVAVRSRMLLRRERAGWRVADSGLLPGLFGRNDSQADPWPTGRSAALRRLADDQLLALSGNDGMMCRLLAPGAPLGGGRGACRMVGGPAEGGSLRLARFAATLTDGAHARLRVTVADTRAVATRRRPGFALRVITRRDRLYAVRTRSGWRLVKPSREFYRAVGQPPPTDVWAPTPTAMWPMPDETLPSVSETPMPAPCRTPPALSNPHTCGSIDGLAVAPRASGGAVVAWSTGFATRTRPIGAGAALAPPTLVAPVHDLAWTAIGLLPVAGGHLLVENSMATLGVRVTPLDADGRPRGAPVSLFEGYENPDDGVSTRVAVGAPGAQVAGVLVEREVLRRLGPDGKAVAPDVVVAGARDALAGTVVVQPDGALMAVSSDGGGRMTVRRVGDDGRPAGATVGQERLAQTGEVEVGPAVAEDAAGHLLILWREDDGHGHGLLRAWRFDPAAPTAGAPVTIARLDVRDETDEDLYTGRERLAVGALPGGGWGVAYGVRTGDAVPVWVARLDASGALVAGPRRFAAGVGDVGYTGVPMDIAGDSVVWVAPPRVAGIPQVRAAPLP
ncbi:MAG TPA: hypothetical protein VNT03_02885 [Baekduia sp.]|nr:hypothetical protein [Baekduia sp.]